MCSTGTDELRPKLGRSPPAAQTLPASAEGTVNVLWQDQPMTGLVIWFTGLSGAGKATLAHEVSSQPGFARTYD